MTSFRLRCGAAASAIAPVRRRVSGLLGTTADRPRPAHRRAAAHSSKLYGVAGRARPFSRSGAAAGPLKVAAGTGNDLAGRALLHSRGPAPDTPQGHPRNDKHEWLVSAPGLHHPVHRPGALPPSPA